MWLICRLKLLFTIHYYQLVDVQEENQSLNHSSKDIIGYDDLKGVVDPNTKNTYEKVERPVSEHDLTVGQLQNLDKHLSNSVNNDVSEGSHLLFKHVFYFFFDVLSIT
jgi:hypothetical protein